MRSMIDRLNEGLEDDHRARIPTKWEICHRCRGDGELGGYPGVYTSDDFAEDPDLFEDYINFSRPCEDCGGSGKQKVADWDHCTPEQRQEVEDWYRCEAEDRAVRRAESGYWG